MPMDQLKRQFGLPHGNIEIFDTNLSVPIGRPIQNVSCHVFQGIQECGLEIPGELYISGDSLSVGYINNDSKNEKSFFVTS